MTRAVSFDYTFRPFDVFLSTSVEEPADSSISRVALSTMGASFAWGATSTPFCDRVVYAYSVAHDCLDQYIYQKILKVWHAIVDQFFKIYRYVESFFYTPFPIINTDISERALMQLYWGLGRENKWKECIDGRYHHLGKYVFDRGTHQGTVEAGFIGSMEGAEGAFAFVERHLNRKINADWYLNLHRRTCAHFNGDPAVFLMGQEKVGVFRTIGDNICCVLSDTYRVSLEAKAAFEALDQELKRELGPSFGLGEMTYTDAFFQTVRLSYKGMSAHQVRQIFDRFLNAFYQEVESARTPDEKLLAIAKLHQRLEWLHPVKDGTSRTSIALLNKLLTDYGFHPAILEYPHVSSSYTLREWKDYLQAGLVKWERQRLA
jgi:Fic/DOC family